MSVIEVIKSVRFGLLMIVFYLVNRSQGVKSSKVSISIRFRIRSQVVLCRLSWIISNYSRRWFWGKRWTFNGWGASYVWIILYVCSKIGKILWRWRYVIRVFSLIVRYLLRCRFVISVRHFFVTTCCLVSVLPDGSCSSICFPKSISHDTAYHSLCDTLTSGTGRYSFDRTVSPDMRCSGT